MMSSGDFSENKFRTESVKGRGRRVINKKINPVKTRNRLQHSSKAL